MIVSVYLSIGSWCSMSLQIGRIPLLSKSKPSMSLKIGLKRLATLSHNKQTPSAKIARDDYLTIVKHVIASDDNQTKNVVVSPPSIHVPLCQCAITSGGSTRAQPQISEIREHGTPRTLLHADCLHASRRWSSFIWTSLVIQRWDLARLGPHSQAYFSKYCQGLFSLIYP